MKKLLLVLLIGLTTVLAACETTVDPVDTPVQCIPGYEEENGKCVQVIPECVGDEVLVNNVCVDPVEVSDLVGPVYQSQGYLPYEGRDITTEACSDLNNIGEWQPVWCDEFNYEGLPDSTLWSYDVGGSGWGNGEAQYYTNADIDNAFVGNGYLTIKAIKEYVSGNEYTSTRLISKNKGDFLYGKIQVRAKVPGGTGTWPAAWMLPTDWEYGGWPASGEIDIMEYVGYQPNVIHATIHTGAYNHSLNTQIGKQRSLSTVEEEFHVFEIEWEPNVIRYYINGIQFFTVGYDPDTMYNVMPYEAWPFDKDFHLLLNLAIGGAWGGVNGIDNSIFPAELQVDYVRVYQKDYEGMDEEAPSAALDMRALDIRQNTVFLAWDIAEDDVMTKEYEVYKDDVLIDTVTHNGILIEGLSPNTAYSFKVVAVDFADNKGLPSVLSVLTESPLTVNDRIEAEQYVEMSGIQVESTSDSGGGQNIGYIDTNDYMTYTISVTESGTYELVSRVASQSGSAGFELLAQNGTVLTTQGVSATGGWQSWTSVTSGSFYLNAGTYTFKVKAIGSGFNINYFEFNKIG